MTALVVTTNQDFSAVPLADITGIEFDTASGAVATFTASQFNNVQIHKNVDFVGDTHFDDIVVKLGALKTFSAALWTFTPGSGGIGVEIDGTSHADKITGSNEPGGNLIVGGAGADTLIGGIGPDDFRYLAAGDIQAGETIKGGAGFDGIQINCNGGTYDFRHATISGVEDLFLNFGPSNGSATVMLKGTQIGGSGISTVQDTASLTDTLLVSGHKVNLSTVDFENWTNGADTLKITGTSEADVLKGSAENDILKGGLGADKLTGGSGSDTFVFSKLAEKGDHITDFVSGVDHLEFDHTGFAHTTAGIVNFASGSHPVASDANGWFLYHTDTGKLYFDSNGDKAGGLSLVATLDGAPDLHAADLILI